MSISPNRPGGEQQDQQVSQFLERLVTYGPQLAASWPEHPHIKPVDLGLVSIGDALGLPDKMDLLNRQWLQSQLVDFVRVLKVHGCIGSTNLVLAELARSTNIDNHLHLAEFQYQGKGRRGRVWQSPYGRNIAMSYGFQSSRSLDDIGGLSLVVGLVVAQVVEDLSVAGVQLKWPNDIWVNDKKLAGVLIELVPTNDRVNVVIGIGLNVSLTSATLQLIDQPTIDLINLGVRAQRNALVVALVTSLRRNLEHFERNGFAEFQAAFDAMHRLHNQPCEVYQGDAVIHGVVRGVGPLGQLYLERGRELLEIVGGEVSVRPQKK